jgi:hypothetical protein
MRRSREQWVQIVEQFERSGHSHEAFCAQHRLNVGSFRGWLYLSWLLPSSAARSLRMPRGTRLADGPRIRSIAQCSACPALSLPRRLPS